MNNPAFLSSLKTIINFLRRLFGVQLRFIVNGLSGLPLSDWALALSQRARNSIFYAFLVKAEIFGWSVISYASVGTSQNIAFPMFNHLTPNGHYMGRTAQLTSKCCILYIYSTNIRTEYFKHAA